MPYAKLIFFYHIRKSNDEFEVIDFAIPSDRDMNSDPFVHEPTNVLDAPSHRIVCEFDLSRFTNRGKF